MSNSSRPEFSTEFVECEIRTPQSCGNILVARSRRNLTWRGGLSVTMNNSPIYSNYLSVCQNQTHYFNAQANGGTGGTSYSWNITGVNGDVSYFTNGSSLSVQFYSSGSILATVTSVTGSCTQSQFMVIQSAGYSCYYRADNLENVDKQNKNLENNRKSILDNIDFNISPNPTNVGNVSIQFNKDILQEQSVEVKLIDLNGKVLLQRNASGNTALLDTNKLSNGVYFVTVISKNFTRTKKLVVQK